MKLQNFEVKIGSKILLKNTNIDFNQGKINYVLGENGIGKSLMAKKIFEEYSDTTLIGSYTNIPQDISLYTLISFLKTRFQINQVQELYNMLNLSSVNNKMMIGKMSDGQKQKIKLLVFFLFNSNTIILDEISNALDRKTVNEIYLFLRKYLDANPSKTIICITHNPLDLKIIDGKYYILKNKMLENVENFDELMMDYMGEYNV